MPVYAALLRGVNVGSSKRMKMHELRGVFESLSLPNAQTYLQSGNVIFESAELELDPIAGRIEAAIESSFGFHSDVILRSADQMEAVVAKNPFASVADTDTSKLLVYFLKREPSADASRSLQDLKAAPEKVVLSGKEVYIHYPNGQGQSKLPPMDKQLKVSGTARNWNSVTNILAIMKKASRGVEG